MVSALIEEPARSSRQGNALVIRDLILMPQWIPSIMSNAVKQLTSNIAAHPTLLRSEYYSRQLLTQALSILQDSLLTWTLLVNSTCNHYAYAADLCPISGLGFRLPYLPTYLFCQACVSGLWNYLTAFGEIMLSPQRGAALWRSDITRCILIQYFESRSRTAFVCSVMMRLSRDGDGLAHHEARQVRGM